MNEAARAAKTLFGCYRTGDANDPAVYATAVVAVLSDYPVEIIRSVVDPRDGLPSTCKWLPTIAEVKEACEQRRTAAVERVESEAWQARLAASRAVPKLAAPEVPYEQSYAYCVERGIRPTGRFEK